MNFVELCGQLPGKRRTVEDIARYVKTRTDDNPNYSLLLGAGCSVTSGIRSAGTLISAWRREICNALPDGTKIADAPSEEQKAFLKSRHSDWYDPNKEYACLFERRYDLQRQRRMFVESEVSKGFPSIGYAYLIALVAQSYFRNIFTTNFDDLINEAFYLYSTQRPIVCAHDSSINSITVTSKRPKVIKLHGDYLFDDIKATLRETESLEQNMKAKFVEFAKESGLIVVGYSGSDRSIMDTLHGILKSDDYLRGGVYWCLRSDAEIPEELRRLFWKDRVYYVEIEGFDELFAELYSKFNEGDVLPDSAITTAKRPNQLAERLVNSSTAIPETTEILRKAKGKLSKQLKRSVIANLLIKSDDDDRLSVQGRAQDLTDDELLVLTETSNLIDEGKYPQAIEKIRTALTVEPRPQFKKRLLQIQIPALRLMGDGSSAIQVVDQLIAMNKGLAFNYLEKARIVDHNEAKLAAIAKAIEVEPYSSRAYLAKGRFHEERSRNVLGTEKQGEWKLAIEAYSKCIECDLSVGNPAWLELFELVGIAEREKTRQLEIRRGHFDRVQSQNPESFTALTMQCGLAISTQSHEEYQSALEKLRTIEGRYGIEECLWIVPLELELHEEHLLTSRQIRRQIWNLPQVCWSHVA